MDLGIAGRTAIVCASSRGLGRGAAFALARAGCRLVVNGRDAAVLEKTAAEIRAETGADVIAIAADVGSREGQEALMAAAPEVDILVNNNGGPPPKGFRELDRAAMLDGVTQNMVTPIELIQRVIDGMIARRFGRIVNITSASVVTPLPGLDLSSGARAGLTSFLAGVSREVAHANVTINNVLPACSTPTGCAAPRRSSRRLKARPSRRWRRRAWRTCPPGASARRRSSARSARSCARARPATSPGRIS